ncbi:monocarboxylate transporter 14-like, partial [Ylistrum balloti]|uniref:monocarboxylate transporter 14-like n=1 Tax=Ylistrum balloti TaxID=509963 RepID=UPI002905E3C0
MSVLNSELLRSFGKSKAETALVQSTTVGVLSLGGAMSGKFVAEYGARITGITASAIVTLGMVLSFFATNIPYLITTLGLVSGMGFSASVISALTSVGEYFEENARLMALSFVSFGTGCGAIVVPYILQYLIAEFGWRGCLLIIGGLLANMACCFGICKPLSVGISKEIKHVDKDVDSPPKENTSDKDVDHIQKESPSRRKWMVLLSGYYVMFVCLGFAFNMSVFNSELLTSFEKGKAETAIVQSITIGSLDIAGLGFSAAFISAATSVSEYFEGNA